MIPAYLEKKLADIEAICSEHDLCLACIVIDDQWDFFYTVRGDDAFMVVAAAILLRGLEQDGGELIQVMRALEMVEEEAPGEEDLDNEELPDGLEEMFGD